MWRMRDEPWPCSVQHGRTNVMSGSAVWCLLETGFVSKLSQSCSAPVYSRMYCRGRSGFAGYWSYEKELELKPHNSVVVAVIG